MGLCLFPMAPAPALPGRLGSNKHNTLQTDPRADPRLVAALAPYGFDREAPAPPVTHNSPLEDIHAFVAEAEKNFNGFFSALYDGLPVIDGIKRRTQIIQGPDCQDIPLHIHGPASSKGPVPCILYIHGGGMAMWSCSSAPFTRFRDELAAAGVVCIGVDFRNSSGMQVDSCSVQAEIDRSYGYSVQCGCGSMQVKFECRDLGWSGRRSTPVRVCKYSVKQSLD